MKRPDDLARMYRQGAETAPLDKSRFITPLDRSSAAEQEGLEIDDKQNIVNLTKAIRRLLKEPGKYPLKDVLENMNAYLANMVESWAAIRADVIEESTVNTELEEQTDPEELGKLFENALTQMLTQDKRQASSWQSGNSSTIRMIDTLITSYALLGAKAHERVNRFVTKLYDASRKY